MFLTLCKWVIQCGKDMCKLNFLLLISQLNIELKCY